MARRNKIDFNVGKRFVRSERFTDEAAYVQDMREQSRAMVEKLMRVVDQFEAITEDVIYDALVPTFEKAKNYTPVDTGKLLASAYLETTSYRGKPRVEMGFARGGIPFYAVLVHENLAVHHNPPTRAKFLEQALKEDLGDFMARLASGYKAATGL